MLLQIKKLSKVLEPLGKRLSKIPANYITIGGLFCALITFFGFYFQFLPIIIIFLFLTELFDQLDGIVARAQGPTQFGGFLDSTLDRYGDFAILIGILFSGYTTIPIALTTLIGALMTSYTRARIEAAGIKDLYGVGLLERTDRIPILLIGSIFQIWFDWFLFWTLIFMAIGTNLTALQRILYAYKHLSHEKKDSEEYEKENM
jgi:archaetidylinositol phosphate synthase